MLHGAFGVGVTVEMAVQEAAYICITFLHSEYHVLGNSPFRYIPRGYLGDEGCYFTLYIDAQSEPSNLHVLAQLTQDQDHTMCTL